MMSDFYVHILIRSEHSANYTEMPLGRCRQGTMWLHPMDKEMVTQSGIP